MQCNTILGFCQNTIVKHHQSAVINLDCDLWGTMCFCWLHGDATKFASKISGVESLLSGRLVEGKEVLKQEIPSLLISIKTMEKNLEVVRSSCGAVPNRRCSFFPAPLGLNLLLFEKQQHIF